MTRTEHVDRKVRGAWATPPRLVEHLLDVVLEPVLAARSTPVGLRVLDPACGDGRFLVAAGKRIAYHFRVTVDDIAGCLAGVELDPRTADEARAALPPGTHVSVGDALDREWPDSFDVVVGNPPYLSQLARATSRGGRSPWGGGPYADAAVAFWALALHLARADGGRVGLVLPQSVLASRDAAAVRAMALHHGALDTLWWSGQSVFDADVVTCIATFVRGAARPVVRRWTGPEFDPLPPAPGEDLGRRPTWSHLVADAAGVPLLTLAEGPVLAERATATAGFRDQFYGLVPFVRDGLDGAPLVTSGLIEPGRCAWGERPARFAGRRFERPGIDLAALDDGDPRLAHWVRARRVPKVLLATQTPVLEAAVDEGGTWVPSVPVISIEPYDPIDLWAIAAVLGSPVASAWAAATYLGAGLGPSAIKLSARQSLAVPWPLRSLDEAATRLRDGDVDGAGAAAVTAYGLPADEAVEVLAWWRGRLSRRRPRRPPVRATSH